MGELNENLRAQRRWIFERLEKKADFKRRLARVLELLKMHSCKFVGISFMTESSLCAAYEERFGESISKRSVGTYVKQLREIGFVSIVPAKRADGKQTANIVVIERFSAEGDDRVSSCAVTKTEEGKRKAASSAEGGASNESAVFEREEDCPEKLAHKESEILRTKKTTSPLKTIVKEIKERMASGRRLLNFVPRWFKDRIGCCAREGREVYEFWKVAKHLKKRTFGVVMSTDEWQEVVGGAIREFFLSAKAATRGKFKMGNPYGFFHAVLEAEGYARVRRQVHESSDLFYNWLEG